MELKISPIFSNKINFQKQNSDINYKTKPMAYDSVSFTGGPKLMGKRSDAVSHLLAKQIHEEAIPVMQDFMKKLTKYFGTLVADEAHPDRPLAFKYGISPRIKSPSSICEKTATLGLGLKNKAGIKEELGDIIGVRLVLRDSTKVDDVVKKLVEGVRSNDIKIYEIENYRPEAKYSYLTTKQLDELEKVSNKMRTNGVTRIDKSLPSGYTATHFSVFLSNGYKGELQIMGIDIQHVKEIEDILYKLKNNKNLDVKYKEIEEMLKELKTNKPLQRAVTAYSREQYINARIKEPYGAKSKRGTKFLPAPDYLPPEYDFNSLHKMKNLLDLQAAKL